MKVAIHLNANSFSDRWIKYCIDNNIKYKIVDAFDNDIIDQIKDCDIFLWHHHHSKYKDVLVAKKILFALDHANIKVFPDIKTGWHFDDKVSQKYLLEAIKVPMVPSYVFYDKKEAKQWIKDRNFPIVFKLKGGAGSANVRLIKNEREAFRIIDKAFKDGFPQFDSFSNLKEKISKYKEGKVEFLTVLKAMVRLFITTEFSKKQAPERDYVYFQDFIPNLDSDIRIQVIGNKIFGLKRFVRENDFRASGSGNFIEFNEENIDKEILKIAIEAKNKLQSQCLTLDFIYNKNQPQIVELSYGFPTEFYDNCIGYWDEDLIWHKANVSPQSWIIESLIGNEVLND